MRAAIQFRERVAFESGLKGLFMTIPDLAELGIKLTATGARLRVWSRHASAMELVLFDGSAETLALPMERHGDTWQIETEELYPGRRYAVRVDGPQGPQHRFDPFTTSLDPYARHVENIGSDTTPRWVSVVVNDSPFDWGECKHLETPMRDTVIYELHVRGFTKLAGFVPPHLRGTYLGLSQPDVIAHLQNLGVTAIELLPVQAFGSEQHLRQQQLTNYWGYNTLGFFAPHAAYATSEARRAGPEAVARELKTMVCELHHAGIEVIMDVVYNHTADEHDNAPQVLFRGIDNATYYRLNEHGRLFDVTGCGNSVDTSQPVVQQFVLDSLHYWHEQFGIDGFRFDLAPTLGRDGRHEYRNDHPLLQAIASSPRLAKAKIIAEPWDVGNGGWQTGNFPHGWSEWNDQYRNRVRRFWVSSFAQARVSGHHREGVGKLATAMAGSSNRFEDARGPIASVNFVTAHDGFTMQDLVSYNTKHNLLNGELGRDGSNDNHSYNFGIEGQTNDEQIRYLRRLAVRNLFGTLLLSAGVPMITAGDEFGRTQQGNNNPYNQDNDLSWVNWDHDEWAWRRIDHVRTLLKIRADHPVLRPTRYNHGRSLEESSTTLEWFDALGEAMPDWEWNSPHTRSVQYLASTKLDAGIDRLLVLVHGVTDLAPFRLPRVDGVSGYRLLWDSAADDVHDLTTDSMGVASPGQRLRVTGPSMRVYAVDGEPLSTDTAPIPVIQ